MRTVAVSWSPTRHVTLAAAHGWPSVRAHAYKKEAGRGTRTPFRPPPMDVSHGSSSGRCCRRSARPDGSSDGNRRPVPHGQGSLPPSFSISSVSFPTTRSPRLTCDSLEGTPGGACWSAQKEKSVSSSRYMMASLVGGSVGQTVVGAERARDVFTAVASRSA
ncbi:hypothetical protein GCM10010109_66200 [Actinoplanes campanulatus]|nr:hypothetical protein GCM10010109_66200 [Actinoplanes campanulatus]GID40289.1 hypothetical protein Aca09nite_67950 [Actinoplanes campanulatus]